MFTPKERLHNVLDGNTVDRPPCICPGGMMNMVTRELMTAVNILMPEAHTDARKMADLAKAVYEEGCFENYGVPFCMTVEAEKLGAKVELGSMMYEPHVVEYCIHTVSDWKTIPIQESRSQREQVVLDAIAFLRAETKGVPIIGNLTGPISTASSILEPVTFYKELRKNNQAAHEYMKCITNQLISFGQSQIEAGADVIAISDPSGTGEILGPKYFQEFAVYYLNQLLAGLKSDRVKTIVHICGQMGSVYKEVNQVCSDALSFDSIVPMKEARLHLENRVLMGNVSTYAIEFGDIQKVKTLTQNCIKNGANIISPACGLGMKSPLANVRALLQTIEEGN